MPHYERTMAGMRAAPGQPLPSGEKASWSKDHRRAMGGVVKGTAKNRRKKGKRG